ncbi:mitochondrial 54S ribosomal protein YmL40 [Pichia kluyveri]|uniref:Mitochondrial 54S ribosomal protein YmL40 n=1 Tax=Pichia kluyveri TaxID=36015 RepID=A0AAV5RBL6_PICKL|nr:mitochondrial 54S ribosomal protein YmL40 [Pichia kluyveri]
MSSLAKQGSKRYGRELSRYPHYIRKMFDQMQERAQIPAFRSEYRQVDENERYNNPRQWLVQPGDTVMITKGKFAGTLTKVVALQKETNRVFLEQSETKRVVVPKQFWQPGQTSHIIDYPLPQHPKDLKVVGTIVNDDGTEKKIAADKLVFKGEYWDEDYQKMMPYRRIKYNENIIIPWPRPDPVEDCIYSTDKNLVNERTFFPNSIIYSDSPIDLINSMRHPLMKRPYKWDKQYLTKSDIKRLVPPQPLLSDNKKAGILERQQIKENLPSKPLPETINLVGDKVSQFLNNITDPHLAKFINKNSPDYKDPKDLFIEKQKKLYDEKIKENQQLNKIKSFVEAKYKLKRTKNLHI